MAEITEDAIRVKAEAIADQVEDWLFTGSNMTAVMMAMAILFGRIEAHAKHPDIAGLMRLASDCATTEFYAHRAELIESGIVARPQ